MRELTGGGVALIALGAFGVVIGVNTLLAVVAVDTFAGKVVDNAYVSGRSFDDDLAAQRSLGWNTEPRVTDGRLAIDFTDAAGRPVRPASLAVTLGRQGTNAEDRAAELRPTARGYLVPEALTPGAWRAEIAAEAADGTRFRQTRRFVVEED
ncbi:MAG: nitrogen fixation protein FixH [Rhodovulum sulfidophilum]|uniref:Nitrogen fixation protein FixH n=1 Tax=Rhodovulum sulfidophilum TaxID=35806 RepID=A0A2W5N8A1_RHOSU|nr:MAG: nitrogen fixation protein FixH [Rhodovulum sulfidophilum]